MLTLVSTIGAVLAAVGLLLPTALHLLTAPFPGKLGFTVLLTAILAERFWFSLFTSCDKNPVKVSADWTFVAVGLAYTVLMYVIALEFYFMRGATPHSWGYATLGAVLLVASVLLRHWAVRHLGKQWAIHVEGTSDAGRHLVTTGPYRLMRHPIYFAAVLEVVGVPLLFNAFWALAWAAGVCIPLVVARVRFEERNSLLVFGQAYRDYQQTTAAFGLGPRRARG